MVDTTDRSHNRATQQLHPWVYRAMAGLAVVLILSVWGFLGPGYSGLALTVVSLFILIAVAIPSLLWLIWSRKRGDERSAAPSSFAAWREDEFEADQGRVKGSIATVEALLPIAAVALGMAIFALVLHFDVGG